MPTLGQLPFGNASNEWEWLDRALKVRMLKEPVGRIRFLRGEEADRHIAALPEHLAAMARFSLATGFARGEHHRFTVERS